jgi:hypothetical protein
MTAHTSTRCVRSPYGESVVFRLGWDAHRAGLSYKEPRTQFDLEWVRGWAARDAQETRKATRS